MSDDKRVSEPSKKYLAVRQENDEYDAAVPLENCDDPDCDGGMGWSEHRHETLEDNTKPDDEDN